MEWLSTLFGGATGITGLLGSLGGAIFRYLAERQAQQSKKMDYDHELAMVDKQAALEQARSQLRMEEASKASEQQLAAIRAQGQAAADLEEIKGLTEALRTQMAPTGNSIIDGLNSSVRPILTYWWCMVMYTAFKICLLIALFSADTKPDALRVAMTLVTDFDMGVIGSLLGFWFMDRTLRKPTGRG